MIGTRMPSRFVNAFAAEVDTIRVTSWFRWMDGGSVPCALTAVDMQDLAGDELRGLEIEDRVDDVRDLAHAADRMNPASMACASGTCMGVLITPGETALTRMPRFAYSMARDRVAAAMPPLVKDVSTDGTLELAWSTRLVVTLAMCPLPDFSISATANCEALKKPERWVLLSNSNSSSVYSVKGLAMKIPALLTNVSMRLNRSMPSAITRCATVRSPMSPATARTPSSDGWRIERELATTR